MENVERTELEEMGEFGLIHHLTKNIKLNQKSTLKGVGDDAAVVDHGSLKTVISTDMLVEGVHFDLMYMPLKHLGYKAAIVNFSDIYAMNAHPRQITVSIAVSNRFSIEALEEIYSGIYTACELYGVDVIGGDTTSSRSGLVISITSIGEAEEKDLAYRDGAKDGELICVSGDLGAAFIGLQLLEREKEIFIENSKVQPDLDGKDYVLERQLKPEARKDIVDGLKELGVKPTSMIDISDGLASELIHLCESSGTGCQIYEEKMPLDPVTINAAEELGLSAMVGALNGGEDYELLFTIPLEDFDKVKEVPQIAVIGHMTDKASGWQMVTRSGSTISLSAQGWDAFFQTKETPSKS